MSILNKLMLAIRGNTAVSCEDHVEVVVDNQVLQDFEQAIAAAHVIIKDSKIALESQLKKQQLCITRYEQIKAKINGMVQDATDALGKGNEALAVNATKVIADYEIQLELAEKQKDEMALKAKSLRQATIAAEINLKRLQQQREVYQTTGVVQEG
ncbi:PspA/IM30 family protein [Spartinivicinus ruber]|uniref:PspA/IM30 family protein n=1 Tax=Spartinivicinus ruber TaxID=2683272 RepID=UPI0013D4D23E|nr:hypothetical protein [Spartinivicinus ruber]